MSQVRPLFISCRRAVVGRPPGLESQRSAGGAALDDLALHASKPYAVSMLGDSVTSPASGVRHYVSLPGCAALTQLADHRRCSSVAPNRKPVHIFVPASSGLSRCESAPRTGADQYMDARGRSDAQVANALCGRKEQNWSYSARAIYPASGRDGTRFAPTAWQVLLLEAAWNARTGKHSDEVSPPQRPHLDSSWYLTCASWHSRCGALCVLSVVSAVSRELAGSIGSRSAETPPTVPSRRRGVNVLLLAVCRPPWETLGAIWA
jgi:hypothetical protein